MKGNILVFNINGFTNSKVCKDLLYIRHSVLYVEGKYSHLINIRFEKYKQNLTIINYSFRYKTSRLQLLYLQFISYTISISNAIKAASNLKVKFKNCNHYVLNLIRIFYTLPNLGYDIRLFKTYLINIICVDITNVLMQTQLKYPYSCKWLIYLDSRDIKFTAKIAKVLLKSKIILIKNKLPSTLSPIINIEKVKYCA